MYWNKCTADVLIDIRHWMSVWCFVDTSMGGWTKECDIIMNVVSSQSVPLLYRCCVYEGEYKLAEGQQRLNDNKTFAIILKMIRITPSSSKYH